MEETQLEFKLQSFEGPLDLLLHLIEKNKVSIYDIPIVSITEQYMDYLSGMQEEDLDVMSDFLVMAATLLRIKAKMLLPRQKDTDDEEEEDPRAELVERLIEYKKIKYAAAELKDMQIDAGMHMYRKQELPEEVLSYRPVVDTGKVIEDTGIDLAGLNRIFSEVMKRMENKVDPVRSRFGKITREKVSVEDKMKDVRERMKGLSGIHFRTLLEADHSRFEVVVTFLAVLELIKYGYLSVRQEGTYQEIYLDSLE